MILLGGDRIVYGFEFTVIQGARAPFNFQLERRISEMQLEALRAQLHPHFLSTL